MDGLRRRVALILSERLTVEDGHLVVQGSGQDKVVAAAESETKFFSTSFDADLEFVKDDQGHVTHLMLRQNGHEVKALKK
jgi:D-alanyl-D-alanine-carboxypeptidase/D-alanyl-D-alanine-endopeptidase